MMKMVMAVVPRDQAEAVLNGLVTAGYTATFCDSRGGVLLQAQKMLFIAAKAEDLLKILQIIREYCRAEIAVESEHSGETLPVDSSVSTVVGGAAVFVWDLEQFMIY
ncbi:MAG: cyclic-di-AMP receptor [Anaerolineae bacterium]|jgi:uncharacterized protein YaaQ|nr:cyclic-di-AMP receptor [Anaerolineae bacterium]